MSVPFGLPRVRRAHSQVLRSGRGSYVSWLGAEVASERPVCSGMCRVSWWLVICVRVRQNPSWKSFGHRVKPGGTDSRQTL